MKRINFIYIATILLLQLTLLNSCLKKELSDYDHGAVPELLLESGLEDKYLLNVGDELKLVSDLSKEGVNPADYTFKWSYYPKDSNTEVIPIEVGTTESLNLKSDMATGLYFLVLEVTNKQSGVKYFRKMDLIVKRLTSEGWLLLTHKSDETNLSIVTPDEYVLKDFLVHSSEYPMREKPLEIICMNDWDGIVQPLAIRTAAPQIYFIDHNTMEVKSNANDAFTGTTNAKFDFFGSDMWYGLYYLRDTDGNFYTAPRGVGENDNFPYGFSNALLGNHVLAPMMIPTSSSYPIQALFYDQENKKLVYHPTSSPEIESFQPAGVNVAFDMNNFDENVIYAANGASGSSYIVGEKNGKYTLYEMRLDNGLSEYPAVSKVNLIAPNGKQLTHFALSGKNPLLYFIAGNQLYVYKMNDQQYAPLYTFPAGEEVAALKMLKEPIVPPTIPFAENRLGIATNSGTEGVFYTFDLSPTGVLKTGSFNSRIGDFSPIVDIVYKESK